MKKQTPNLITDNIRTASKPSELRITDLKIAEIEGAPMHCILLKIETNQGITGFGEVRDWADAKYALNLKARLIGENPCEIDRLFRKIKQFGGHSRFAGGVCGVELALWDIAGKAYGVPVYQMLGGRFRDKVRMYCDTDIDGKPDGIRMGEALKSRIENGFTLVKMDLGIDLLYDVPGALSAPAGVLESIQQLEITDLMKYSGSLEERYIHSRKVDAHLIPHPFSGIQITEAGLEWIDNYCKEVRSVIGYDIPIAIDHIGHISVNECIKLGKRIEKYNIAWMEDAIPWMYTDQYKRLQAAVNIPICTGEDIYLKENFRPLLEAGGVSVVHPDILTSGGILETKKISDMALDYGVAMAIHMAESPIACMAAAHVATACENFLALEFHSFDIPWWNDIAKGIQKPIVDRGFITVPDEPGLGIPELNDEVIAEHSFQKRKIWESTDEWKDCFAFDRTWS